MKGMKWERLLLVAFFGNYLINNVVAGLASLVPPSSGGGYLTPQYILYVICAAVVVGLVTWWYFNPLSRMNALMGGLMFGVGAFVISILTTFVSGIANVLAQTGSVSQVASVLPNFGPYIWSWSTLFLLGFWVIPAVLVGWWLQRGSRPMVTPAAHQPMMGSSSQGM